MINSYDILCKNPLNRTCVHTELPQSNLRVNLRNRLFAEPSGSILNEMYFTRDGLTK